MERVDPHFKIGDGTAVYGLHRGLDTTLHKYDGLGREMTGPSDEVLGHGPFADFENALDRLDVSEDDEDDAGADGANMVDPGRE